MSYAVVSLVVGYPLGARAASNGIIGESTDTYSTCGIFPDLSNRLANTEGFLNGMSTSGSISWPIWADWADDSVWDRDFVDSDINSSGDDTTAFDPVGGAIAFFSGHGVCDDTSSQSCTTSSQCTSPGPGQSLPGVCTEGPNRSSGTCLYYRGRQVVTCSTNDAFGHFLDYSDGLTAFGESSFSGGWRGAGTNGGINFAVIDNSCGVRPGLEIDELWNAFGGVHNIGLVEPTTVDADNIDVSERGAKFAARWRANNNSAIAPSWIDTLNDMSGSEGSSCNGTSAGGHGIDGCGAYIAASVAQSQDLAQLLNGSETWIQAQNDGTDPTGASWLAWIAMCNYDCNTYPLTI